MKEEKLVKTQLIKNMIATLITFTIIFTVFSMTIFKTVESNLYQNVDNELLHFMNKKDTRPVEGKIHEGQAMEIKREIKEEPVNPRLVYITRDEMGNITNADSIGRIYEDYLTNLQFDKTNLNQIQEVILNEEYHYRGITYKELSSEGEEVYIQLLINVDSETEIINRFAKILIIGTILTILLSILASYFLSKKTLKPIIKSWEKQTEFVQNASHELRTPLTIIQAKQELLLQQPESKIIDKVEDITLTLKETKRLTKLIKDLMILARADSNQITLNKELVPLDALLKEIILPYEEYAQLQEKEIRLNLQYNKPIKVDVNRISQLMVILLDNAIKYTEQKDRIEINTYAKEGKCFIEVKDTGIGIDEQAVKHVFERFYRADKARNRETGGTGLGLSIAHWIVTSHGGSIRVVANKPKGSIFIIKL